MLLISVDVESDNKDWKKLRQTKHSHLPVDDCKGNAEVLLKTKEMGLKMPSE